jgi:PIN domain nuclease of toxin-antitoxin system
LNLLLDTQVAIWAVAEPDRLRPESRRLIADRGNDVVVSAISICEIAIKYRLRKRFGAPPFSAARALELFRMTGFRILNLAGEHGTALETLPDMHADPFDRLLLAQALHEPLRLLTADAMLWPLHDSVIPA